MLILEVKGSDHVIDKKLQELIEFVHQEDNIRALVLQGSVVNPNVTCDVFSDLDPLFYCVDPTKYTNNDDWKARFGEVISYFSDSWETPRGHTSYTRLTLYKDSFKMDFGFTTIKEAPFANEMPLYQVVIDKDNLIPPCEVTDDRKFYHKQPTSEEVNRVYQDFYFDTSYVVKSIYREELVFTKFMMNILHEKMKQLLQYYVGANHQYQVNIGAEGRYLKQYLSPAEWTMVQQTYQGYQDQDNIDALRHLFQIIKYLGLQLEELISVKFPHKLHNDMLSYCEDKIAMIQSKKR